VGRGSTGVQSFKKKSERAWKKEYENKLKLPNTITSGSPSLDGGLDHKRASPSPKTKQGQWKVAIRATNKERLCLTYETRRLNQGARSCNGKSIHFQIDKQQQALKSPNE